LVAVSPLLSLAGLLLSIAPALAQAADTQHVYSQDQLTVAPVVLREPTAIYPDSLKRSGIGGTVRVSVVLDRKGHADSGSVRIVSTPDTALNGPARAVVLGSSFAPGRVEDGAVRVLIVVGVAFDPLDTATTPPPIYGEGDSLTQKPALLSGPPIQYPEDSRRNHIQGRVLVQMILDTLGRVERESIQFATTPDPGFLMPVQQYLAFARFRPARRNGRLVRSIVHMPIDFRLRGGPPFPCPITAEFRFRCRP
jgi:TonB family protein